MKSNRPVDLVLVGGGHAHVQVLKSFYENPIPHVNLKIVSDQIHTPHIPLQPAHLSGLLDFPESQLDLPAICRRAGVTFIHDAAVKIDRAQSRLFLESRPFLPFDVLSLNVGSFSDVPFKQDERIIALRPYSQFYQKWKTFLSEVEAFEKPNPPKVAVIGGGSAGVEMAFILAQKLRGWFPDATVDLLEKQSKILPNLEEKEREIVLKNLAKAKIYVHCKTDVTGYKKGTLETADRKSRNFDYIFWAASSCGPQWISESELSTSKSGFVKIDRFLRMGKNSAIFAAGECAAIDGKEHLRSQTLSVAQGPVLSENLRRASLGKSSFVPFDIATESVPTIFTGGKSAITRVVGVQQSGRLAWGLKNRQGKAFVSRFGHKSYESRADGGLSPYGSAEKQLRSLFNSNRIPDGVVIEALDETDLTQKDKREIVKKATAGQVIASKGSSGIFFEHYAVPIDGGDWWAECQLALRQIQKRCFADKTKVHEVFIEAQILNSSVNMMKSQLNQILMGVKDNLIESRATLGGWRFYCGDLQRLKLTVFAKGKASEPPPKLQTGDCVILTHPLGSSELKKDFHSQQDHLLSYYEMRKNLIEGYFDCLKGFRKGKFISVMKAMQETSLHTEIYNLIGHRKLAFHGQLDVIPYFGCNGAPNDLDSILLSTYEGVKCPELKRSEKAELQPKIDGFFSDQFDAGYLVICPKKSSKEIVTRLHEAGADSAQVIGTFQSKKDNYWCVLSKS